MEKKDLNELVIRLTEQRKVATQRPDKTAKSLKECIDRDYVHVMFTETGTELGVQLYRPDCQIEDADFDKSKGKIHLEGGLTLNYDKVRCVADIDLNSCEGTGFLVPVDDAEYAKIMGREQ